MWFWIGFIVFLIVCFIVREIKKNNDQEDDQWGNKK